MRPTAQEESIVGARDQLDEPRSRLRRGIASNMTHNADPSETDLDPSSPRRFIGDAARRLSRRIVSIRRICHQLQIALAGLGVVRQTRSASSLVSTQPVRAESSPPRLVVIAERAMKSATANLQVVVVRRMRLVSVTMDEHLPGWRPPGQRCRWCSRGLVIFRTPPGPGLSATPSAQPGLGVRTARAAGIGRPATARWRPNHASRPARARPCR